MGAHTQEIQQVHPRDFWVMFTLVALVGLCHEFCYLFLGHFPQLPPWLLGIFLGTVWSVFICGWIRGGGNSLSPAYSLALAGYTLLIGDFLLPEVGTIPLRHRVGMALTGFALVVTYIRLWSRK